MPINNVVNKSNLSERIRNNITDRKIGIINLKKIVEDQRFWV